MISLIIPTLNAEKYMKLLLDKLCSQTVIPDEIIVLDSESDDKTVEICEQYSNVKVINIKRKDFDHGGTRHAGFVEAQGDFCFVMSQDALPVDDLYIESMLSAFDNPEVVMATGRQVPYPDATCIEKLTREYNYPDVNIIKDNSSIRTMGIKAYFFSDVCSAYRKDAYFKLGGYETPSLICTDMVMSAKAINAGYKVAYVGKAKVYHSHKYTLSQQYRRNFDVAADMSINEKLFLGVSDTKEGIKMVKHVLKELIKGMHFLIAFYYCIDCGAKLFGNRAGKKYKKYNKKQLLKRTGNKNYWYRSGRVS